MNCPPRQRLRVSPEYTVVVDANQKYAEVSDSFCKVMGYRRQEIIGRQYVEFTALRTNDVPTVDELFLKLSHMHGIWICVNHSGTRILVRYEAWFRPDGQIECQMDPMGAGASMTKRRPPLALPGRW
jgi:PAS domain S-box-containing protein